jgi:hypothetical protein
MSIALLIATTALAVFQSTTVSFGGNSAEFTLKLDLTEILFAYACRIRHLYYTIFSADVNYLHNSSTEINFAIGHRNMLL